LAIVVVLGTGVGAIATGCARSSGSPTTTRVRVTTTVATPTTSPFGVLKPIDALAIGQCFDELPEPRQQPYAVLVIPCEELHTYEVFDQKKYTAAGKTVVAGTAYPGDLVISNDADDQCIAGFQAFIGVEWAASHYEEHSWWPTQESWTAKNDRNIICAVTRVGGVHTKGSARGIND
jgi:hypothetical protein